MTERDPKYIGELHSGEIIWIEMNQSVLEILGVGGKWAIFKGTDPSQVVPAELLWCENLKDAYERTK